MQAIQLPPINARPLPRINSGMESFNRADCQICSVVGSIPCFIMGGVIASMANNSTNIKEALLYGIAGGGLITAGVFALLNPLIQHYSATREIPALTPQAAPSPRYALPPLAANDHVVVEMPDRSFAMGLEEEHSRTVNQS